MKRQLRNECGGHRIQRIPPTERKGRVHTSTVTVSVLEHSEARTELTEADLKVEWFSGTGAGGQHRNKTQNSCRLTHLPTGIVATASTRSRTNSYNQAFSSLKSLLTITNQNATQTAENAIRKQNVGSGMRGDKIRTYRFQDDVVTDHRTGKRAKVKDIMRGNFEQLW